MVKLIKKLNKSRKHSQKKSHSKSRRNQKGGAIYTFDLNDKIGGLPAYQALNGTKDGDCPSTDTKDLGFVNYGMTKGGARKTQRRSHKNKKTRHSHKNKKTSRK